ncbi:MAG TPA: site-specific DNA-methyltransferase [Pirellulales bacterium]|nr:site-specific DNA-methyltransferase [Pirellulales bacterium]
MALAANQLYQGDCIARMRELEEGSVDLVFADPPFNIGYDYDVYDDSKPDEHYLDFSRHWIKAVCRVLKPSGTFWLAIGDEYAAELKLIAQNDAGFTCRSWVIWYYTFGVNCTRKFTRSHAHLFHFVRDAKQFTFNFNDPAIRVPSARQLVYADIRANPNGRLPDDTWILRPQDVPGGFSADQDTWYFSRVAGTFKERAGFHGCQMPEQLLGRIIRASSNENDLVLDPFAGSGTTLAVAKKLGRRWMGFELSSDYVGKVRARLDSIEVGQPLDGPENPVTSAPPTAEGRRLEQKRAKAARKDAPQQTLEFGVEPASGTAQDAATTGFGQSRRRNGKAK